jgi:hypothetical protein
MLNLTFHFLPNLFLGCTFRMWHECTFNLKADSLSPCVKVSAAPKGEIDVEFSIPATSLTDPQVVSIGIVAVLPNTQVKLKCTAIPTGGTGPLAKTVSLRKLKM